MTATLEHEFPMIPPQVNGATDQKLLRSLHTSHHVSNDSAPS